jgi:hypothetical protein
MTAQSPAESAGQNLNARPAAPALARENRFDWPLCYDAENLVLDRIEAFCGRNTFAASLADRMRSDTGTLLVDWVDHLELSADAEAGLRTAGFTNDPLDERPAGARFTLWHPDALLPRLVLDRASPPADHPHRLAIRVDSLADFMVAQGIEAEPQGPPLSSLRRLIASQERETCFEVVERRGYRGWVPGPADPVRVQALLQAHELWTTRRRVFDNDADGFHQTLALLDRVVAALGPDLACHIIFAAERIFWERRNRAARIQKRRQDGLGLGWANHDHHTFRSSRAHFLDLMRALEHLGFERRERYYAGAQAGWGAQILEQPVEGLVAFCDVDLEPAETEIDFSRLPLPPAPRLGTIGLWVGLHGESFLDAGMHHLECRFDHNLLRDQLAAEQVATMKPFSDFPFLKQAFTEGERWPVRRERAERLLRAGLIDESQFARFTSEGAIGSHLENLQRKGGFKGFNQKSVSAIIQATDPRHLEAGQRP